MGVVDWYDTISMAQNRYGDRDGHGMEGNWEVIYHDVHDVHTSNLSLIQQLDTIFPKYTTLRIAKFLRAQQSSEVHQDQIGCGLVASLAALQACAIPA